MFFGTNKKKEKLYNVYRPNTGRQLHTEPLSNIKRKYKKVNYILRSSEKYSKYKKTLNEFYVNSYLGGVFLRKNVFVFMKQITQYNLSFPGFARYC